MNFVTLAATTNFILRPLAWLLSFIINGIYYVVSLLTKPQSMAITIFLMTVAVRLLMTPLTVKQQRSSRKMQRLQPQQQAIQAKYKNKTDPEAQQKMNAEIQKLYADNKTSPLSGCLPLLIQMPILFALYEIFRNIPFYVNQISDIFNAMAAEVQNVSGYTEIIGNEIFASATRGIKNFDASTVDGIKDFLYHISGTQWKSFFEMSGLEANSVFMSNFELQKTINTFGAGFFTWNLTETPAFRVFDVKWVMPFLAGGLTLAQTLISDAKNKKRAKIINPNYVEDETQKSSKTMMYISPIMILVFGFSVPIGLSLYWIASSVIGIISQEIVDAILDRQEYKEVLAKKAAFEEKQQLDRALYGKNANFNSAWDAANRGNSKSSMAGNKAAAQLEKQKKDFSESDSTDSVEEEN